MGLSQYSQPIWHAVASHRWHGRENPSTGWRVGKPRRHDSMWPRTWAVDGLPPPHPRTSDRLVPRKEAETTELGACFSFAGSKPELPREEGPGKCVLCLRAGWWHHVTAGSRTQPWGWHPACTHFRATGSKDFSTHTYHIITVYTNCAQFLSRVQLFFNPMDCSLSGSPVHEVV